MLDSLQRYSRRHPRTYAATIAAGGVAIGFAAFRFRDLLSALPAVLLMYLGVAFVCVGAVVGWLGDRYWAFDDKWSRAFDWQDVKLRQLVVIIVCSMLMMGIAVVLLYWDRIAIVLRR